MKRNIVFIVSVTGALILHLFLAWQPLAKLEGLPYFEAVGPLKDDSYIIFSISRDLVSWFSGSLPSFQLSSGFQPLIALLYCPFFYIFSGQKELPIHLSLSLNAFLGLFANIFLYRLLRKIGSRSVSTFLISAWIWSPYVMNQTINGMETTLALFLLLVTLNHYWKINCLPLTKSLSWLFLGLLLGIGFLARVDLGMAGVAIVLDQTWLAIKDDRTSRLLRLRNIFLCSLTALAVASPWIVFTFVSTGTIMPVSGKAVYQETEIIFRYLNPNYSSFAFMMLAQAKEKFLLCLPLVASSKHTSWQLFISGLSLIGFILAVRNRELRVLIRPVWFFQIIMIGSYIGFIGAFWYLPRYFFPVFTLILLLHAVALNYLELRLKLKSWVPALTFFFLFIPYALSYTFQYHSLWSEGRPTRYLAAALFARDHISPKAKVGAFQSGCLSYWLDNKVINLDGVINEKAYFHIKNRSLVRYLEKEQIEYIVDENYAFGMWDRYLRGQLSKRYAKVTFKGNKSGPISLFRWSIYKRKP